jgi:hypothetical protein
MVEYRVISEFTRINLETVVNAKMTEGWKLAGGVSVDSGQFNQAMTREPAYTTVLNDETREYVKTRLPYLSEHESSAPVAPQSKTDQEKLVDVLTEIGIDFKQNGDRIDIAHDWMIKDCDYTAVLFKPDGSYYRMT